jgi:hypothetical protein
MRNVISMPEKHMKRVKKEQQSDAKRAILSLSLVSLILGAVLVNDSVNRAQRPTLIVSDSTSASDIENLNRAIASAHPMNPFRDLEWEKKMAERLSQDSIEDRTPASIGRKVTTLDEMRFGPLAGKYQVVSTNMPGASMPAVNRVNEIRYVDSVEVADRPVFLDPAQFLKDYGRLLSVDFEFFDRANPAQQQVREYRLLDSSKHVVGTAAFVMDEEGRFISLKVREGSAIQ